MILPPMILSFVFSSFASFRVFRGYPLSLLLSGYGLRITDYGWLGAITHLQTPTAV
jgi:hypothetical protein